MATNRAYTVFNASDSNDITVQKIANFIRYSLDETQLIVEWIGAPPEDVIVLTHEEAVRLMSTPEWFRGE